MVTFRFTIYVLWGRVSGFPPIYSSDEWLRNDSWRISFILFTTPKLLFSVTSTGALWRVPPHLPLNLYLVWRHTFVLIIHIRWFMFDLCLFFWMTNDTANLLEGSSSFLWTRSWTSVFFPPSPLLPSSIQVPCRIRFHTSQHPSLALSPTPSFRTYTEPNINFLKLWATPHNTRRHQ